MELEAYWKCRQAVEEAREILNTVATTSSVPVAAAACRRALRLCCQLDHDLNGTNYPGDFAAGPAIELFRIRHPRLFAHESILHPKIILMAVEWRENDASPAGVDRESELERVFLPAARSIRLMLDDVAVDLRKPGRWSWRVYAVLFVFCVGFLGVRWAWMMSSREGLTVTYFRGANFKRPVYKEVAKKVEASYGESSVQISRNRFSSRWEGTLVTPVTTNYAFYSQSVGGMRVFIDGAVVLDNWREVPWNASGTHGNKDLDAGDHAIVVEYFKSRGSGVLRLRWAGGPIPDNTVLGVPYLKR